MVNVKTNYSDFQKLLGRKADLEEIDKLIAFAKSEVEGYDEEEDELQIDCKTSNRPDLWSAEGLIREVKGIEQKEKGIPKFEVNPSGIRVEVSKKLEKTRPFIACAVAKNIQLSDQIIKQLMQVSEKIDLSYGRKRKRTSIGMYNLSMIESPVKYDIVDENYKFVPLGFDKEMTVKGILKEHPKGQEYGQILEEYKQYPILISANGQTLSMPPVINSNDVGRITEETQDCLIEVTGSAYDSVIVVLNIICQVFVDRGAEIFSVEIVYPKEIKEESDVTPILTPKDITVKCSQINEYLGTKVTPKKVVELMKKRRFDAKTINKDEVIISIPPYRDDILHWVDISEEIAIALDYNTLGPTTWEGFTIGGLLEKTEHENVVRDILVGAGAVEVLTNILTDPVILTENVNREKVEFIQISNPVSQTYSVLRDQIFPGMINLLGKNTHEQYPQAIFEVGEVVKATKESLATQTNAAFLYADAESSFEDAHKVLDRLLKLLEVEYELKPIDHPSFSNGRCGEVYVKGTLCGVIGEYSPKVLEKNMIWVPIVGFEVELHLIPSLKCVKDYTF